MSKTLAVSLAVLLFTAGCMGFLQEQPSEPEMDEPDDSYRIHSVMFDVSGGSVTFTPVLWKNESDKVTVIYELSSGGNSSSKTFYQVENSKPSHDVPLPPGTTIYDTVTVRILLKDGNETVSSYNGEFDAGTR